MALRYNKETAVERDIKTQTDSNYSFLEGQNVGQESQNELSLYNFTPTQEGTYTQEVTQDFILTNISCFLQSGSSSTKTNVLYIDAEKITELRASPTVAGDNTVVEKEIAFPNVLVRQGSELKLVATESGAQQLNCSYSFIGYLV
jgi:hypothetical protein